MTTPSTPPLVELNGVSKQYGSPQQPNGGIRDISLAVYPGELLLLLGPSGSGKTTLLTLMAGFIGPNAGKVTLFGSPITSYSGEALQQIRASRLGFIFQTFMLIDSLKVIENVELVMRFAPSQTKDRRAHAFTLLDMFQISHLANQYPSQLSQGEKQRVAIARAVANDAPLLLADEPTASLSAEQGAEIIHLLHEFVQVHQKGIIVASHDLRLVPFSDRVLHIENGRLIKE